MMAAPIIGEPRYDMEIPFENCIAASTQVLRLRAE
jgi:hypothetical protein